MAVPLLETAGGVRRLQADKACDADSLRNRLRSRRTTAVIRLRQNVVSCRARRDAGSAEDATSSNAFLPAENGWRTATGYGGLAQDVLSAIALVAVASEGN